MESACLPRWAAAGCALWGQGRGGWEAPGAPQTDTSGPALAAGAPVKPWGGKAPRVPICGRWAVRFESCRRAAGSPGRVGEGSRKVASTHRPAGSNGQGAPPSEGAGHPEAAVACPAPQGRGRQWLVRVSAAQGGAMSLRCGQGHRNQPKYKRQQKPAGAEAQIHSEREGECKA